MKDIKDKILEILKKGETCPFAGHSFLSAIDGNTYPEIASKIESLINKNYVPKDRICFICEKTLLDENNVCDRCTEKLCSPFFNDDTYSEEFVDWYGRVVTEIHGQYGSMKLPDNMRNISTISDVFEYWKDNIKDK